jgi:hypothetical protein
MVSEGQDTMRFSNSPENSPRKMNYNNAPQIVKLPSKQIQDPRTEVKIEKLTILEHSKIPLNFSPNIIEQPVKSVILAENLINS